MAMRFSILGSGSSGNAAWLPPLLDHLARMDIQVIVSTAGAKGVVTRGKGEEIWGWSMAYGGSAKVSEQPGGKA